MNKNFCTSVKNISVFFLCYNDANTITELIESAMKILKDIVEDYEIIVVNDGSTDGSYKILEELKKRYVKLKVIHHSRNMGYGAAIKTGFRVSKNDFVFYTDGDGQYDINEIIKLLSVIDEADVVNGFLYKRLDPFYRIILGKIYQMSLRLLLKININYVDCDFRLFRRKVIDNIDLNTEGGFICAEMMKRIIDRGYKIKEIGIHHYPRKNGQSKFFNFYNIYKLIADFIKFYLTYRSNVVQKKTNQFLRLFG